MKSSVWVVDDDQSIRWVLEKALAREHIPVKCFTGPNEVFDALEKDTPQVVLTDIRMPRGNGLTLLQQLREDYPKLPVIVMTAYSDMDSAVNAHQGGAYEYITKPFDMDLVISLIRRALSESTQVPKIETKFANHFAISHESPPEIIGQAPAMQEIFRAIGRLANSTATVLIIGESGSGKQLVAKAVHRHGARGSGPFVEMNLAATPKDLIEVELFGYERGAFANASMLKRGNFELADGGTLFLDEIGDMPLHLQSSLLRLLENGSFNRMGGSELLHANVRIIASTYRNLESLVQQGLFREDLYHRLNVIRLNIPALRERLEDLPALAQHFLTSSAKDLKIKPKVMTSETLEALSRLDFPGNIRQLESLCHWLSVMVSSPEISSKDLPSDMSQYYFDESKTTPKIVEGTATSSFHSVSNQSSVPQQGTWEYQIGVLTKRMIEEGREDVFGNLLAKFEKVLIQSALEITRGRKVEAAERLGIGRNTITRKVQELGIEEK